MKHKVSRSPTPRSRLWILVLLAVAGGAILALFPSGVAPLPPLASPSLSPEEQAYVDTIGVRVLAMNDELQAISLLVSKHSRNVLELNRRGTHVEQLAAEIEGIRGEQPVPPRFAAFDLTAQQATGVALDAIGQARDALRTFDFSGIADLIPSFNNAAAAMNQAALALEAITSSPTPVTLNNHS